MKVFKFNVQTFDEEGNVVNDDNFRSIQEIADNYENFSYSALYYLVHYDAKKTKPSKKVTEMMKRFKITHIVNNDLFRKKTHI